MVEDLGPLVMVTSLLPGTVVVGTVHSTFVALENVTGQS